ARETWTLCRIQSRLRSRNQVRLQHGCGSGSVPDEPAASGEVVERLLLHEIRPSQLPEPSVNSDHCCDFAAAHWAPRTVAIASMVSPGGCQSQSFFGFTRVPFPSSSPVV